ncbi:unnamed protein product [Paramecium octaurelia]|uniref:Uncharacterized protein n=1 Tax=Paramecium octaurelia TaxID=43137 RepID=A0A8S1V467_PAROT|nr:unnamed protein product [Paramecium octaurelia]
MNLRQFILQGSDFIFAKINGSKNWERLQQFEESTRTLIESNANFNQFKHVMFSMIKIELGVNQNMNTKSNWDLQLNFYIRMPLENVQEEKDGNQICKEIKMISNINSFIFQYKNNKTDGRSQSETKFIFPDSLIRRRVQQLHRLF